MEDSISEKSHKDSSTERNESRVENTESFKRNAASTGQHEIDPHLDRRLNRKFDLHIVPILFGLWLLAFIDRYVSCLRGMSVF
jgi:hypothetical protein